MNYFGATVGITRQRYPLSIVYSAKTHQSCFPIKKSTESYQTSKLRHEHGLVQQLDLKKGIPLCHISTKQGLTHSREGMHVLDVGCGVGGPARNMARLSGATITGMDSSDFHLSRAHGLTVQEGLARTISYVKVRLFFSRPSEDLHVVPSISYSPRPLIRQTFLRSCRLMVQYTLNITLNFFFLSC